MVNAAKALSVRRESRLKGFNKDKVKEGHQFIVTKPEPTDFSKVLGKTDEHTALALVYL